MIDHKSFFNLKVCDKNISSTTFTYNEASVILLLIDSRRLFLPFVYEPLQILLEYNFVNSILKSSSRAISFAPSTPGPLQSRSNCRRRVRVWRRLCNSLRSRNRGLLRGPRASWDSCPRRRRPWSCSIRDGDRNRSPCEKKAVINFEKWKKSTELKSIELCEPKRK